MSRIRHKSIDRLALAGIVDLASMAGAALLVLAGTLALVGCVGFLVVASLV